MRLISSLRLKRLRYEFTSASQLNIRARSPVRCFICEGLWQVSNVKLAGDDAVDMVESLRAEGHAITGFSFFGPPADPDGEPAPLRSTTISRTFIGRRGHKWGRPQSKMNGRQREKWESPEVPDRGNYRINTHQREQFRKGEVARQKVKEVH